jgi:subtilisin family serine protease
MFGPLPRVTRRLAAAPGLILALTLTCVAPAASAGPVLGAVLAAGHPDAVAGSYLVELRDGPAVTDAVRTLAGRHGLRVRFTYTAALRGFAVHGATERQARQLAADPAVARVTQDRTVRLPGRTAATTAAHGPTAPMVDCPLQPCVQQRPGGLAPPSWADLDRIDQRTLPLDNLYHYPNSAHTVWAYVIDSGIRTTHQDFGGRATWGANTTGDGNNSDCNGHGTHIAGTIGGSVFGVAKHVRLVAVKVLNCAGSGTVAAVVAGVDWATVTNRANGGRGVAIMGATASGVVPALDNAILNSIASGLHHSVPAGDHGQDACLFSPSRVPSATTVASSTSADVRSSFSGHGTCVDLYAPGTAVTAAWHTSDATYNTLSGTAMAAAHLTGMAALWRHRFPAGTPAQTGAALTSQATPNLITGNPAGTPNLLAFTGSIPV